MAVADKTNDAPSLDDRLSIRERPRTSSIMHQTWGKLLFIHWPISPELIRPLVPAGLELDLFEGTAWVAIAPFTMWGIRPRFTPTLPLLNRCHELNVRTYVYVNRVPGVWFFSLDANHALAVLVGRQAFHLPYFKAEIELEQSGQTIDYRLSRSSKLAQASFEATWQFAPETAQAEPGSLEFFLIERYSLYAADRAQLYRARIWHRPWALHRASLTSLRSTMLESHGMTTPNVEPLLHYSESLQVEIWPPQKV